MTINLLPWWAFAAAGAVAGALLAGGVQQARVSGVEADFAEYREQQAQANAAAAQAARAAELQATEREHALQAEIDHQDQEARNAQAQLTAARAAAATAADRLRIALDTIRHSRRDAPSAAAPIAGQCAADRLAKLLAGADDLAGRSSEAADNAIRRGLMCEAAYDAARQALTAR